MRNFSEIKHRIKSVSDTRKITGAMEMISVAKMRKAVKSYESNKAYFSALRKVISDIAARSKNVAHKALCASSGKNTAYIVVASDKGLAGSFNHDILAHAEKVVSGKDNARLFAIGHVCAEYFKSRDFIVDDTFVDASYDPSIMRAAEIGETVYGMFERGGIDRAYIVYTAMQGNKAVPERLVLLPIDDCVSDCGRCDEISYEPSAEEVLCELIPQYLTGIIYGALVQSSLCEHEQRRSAMNNSTRNADELLEKLKSEYNRARQETVTGELMEIVTASYGERNDD